MDDFDPSLFGISFDNTLASVALEMVSSFNFAKIAVTADVLIHRILPDTRATDSNQHGCSFRWIHGNRLLSTGLLEATGKLFALPVTLFPPGKAAAALTFSLTDSQRVGCGVWSQRMDLNHRFSNRSWTNCQTVPLRDKPGLMVNRCSLQCHA